MVNGLQSSLEILTTAKTYKQLILIARLWWRMLLALLILYSLSLNSTFHKNLNPTECFTQLRDH